MEIEQRVAVGQHGRIDKAQEDHEHLPEVGDMLQEGPPPGSWLIDTRHPRHREIIRLHGLLELISAVADWSRIVGQDKNQPMGS